MERCRTIFNIESQYDDTVFYIQVRQLTRHMNRRENVSFLIG